MLINHRSICFKLCLTNDMIDLNHKIWGSIGAELLKGLLFECKRKVLEDVFEFEALILRGGVSRPRAPASPWCGRVFSLFFFLLISVLAHFGLPSQKEKKKKKSSRR